MTTTADRSALRAALGSIEDPNLVHKLGMALVQDATREPRRLRDEPYSVATELELAEYCFRIVWLDLIDSGDVDPPIDPRALGAATTTAVEAMRRAFLAFTNNEF